MEFANSNDFIFLIYFIGGYFVQFILCSYWAAVDNQTDSQQFLLPVIMPLMLSVYVFLVLSMISWYYCSCFSMIPLTSPIVMLMRIPFMYLVVKSQSQ
jgi:ABC-2 type transport system permease protein